MKLKHVDCPLVANCINTTSSSHYRFGWHLECSLIFFPPDFSQTCESCRCKYLITKGRNVRIDLADSWMNLDVATAGALPVIIAQSLAANQNGSTQNSKSLSFIFEWWMKVVQQHPFLYTDCMSKFWQENEYSPSLLDQSECACVNVPRLSFLHSAKQCVSSVPAAPRLESLRGKDF